MVHSYNGESSDSVQCKGSLTACFFFAFWGGLVLYCLQYFLCLLLHIEEIYVLAWDICGRFPFIPYSPWTGTAFCILVCMGIGLFLRARVRTYDDEIRIAGCGRTISIPLKAFHHIEVKTTRIPIELIPVYRTVDKYKCYLYYNDGSTLKRRRLYGFNGRLADVLKNQIRIKSTQQAETDGKMEIAASVDSGLFGERTLSGTKFDLDRDRLFAKEALFLRKRLLLCGLLGAVCLIFVMLSHGVSDPKLYELGTLGVILFLIIPVKIVLFRRRKELCPAHISVSSAGLLVDNKYFAYSRIKTIQLRKVSDSPVYPSQHYMVIRGETGAKFWLGSDASYPEYASFCSTLQKAMALCPDKLEYRNIVL